MSLATCYLLLNASDLAPTYTAAALKWLLDSKCCADSNVIVKFNYEYFHSEEGKCSNLVRYAWDVSNVKAPNA